MHSHILLAGLPAADAPKAGNAQLVLAALLGIAAVVVLITVLKMHPFLALILGSAVLGLVAALGAPDDHRQLHQGRRQPPSAASGCSSRSAP